MLTLSLVGRVGVIAFVEGIGNNIILSLRHYSIHTHHPIVDTNIQQWRRSRWYCES